MANESLKELLDQKEQIEQKIVLVRKEAVAKAIAQVKEIVSEFGLTSADIFPSGKVQRTKIKMKAPVKFRHPDTGETWSGRGIAPKWIGDDRERFRV